MRVRIEDEDVVYEFDGELIAGPVSTRLDRMREICVLR